MVYYKNILFDLIETEKNIQSILEKRKMKWDNKYILLIILNITNDNSIINNNIKGIKMNLIEESHNKLSYILIKVDNNDIDVTKDKIKSLNNDIIVGHIIYSKSTIYEKIHKIRNKITSCYIELNMDYLNHIIKKQSKVIDLLNDTLEKTKKESYTWKQKYKDLLKLDYLEINECGFN